RYSFVQNCDGSAKTTACKSKAAVRESSGLRCPPAGAHPRSRKGPERYLVAEDVLNTLIETQHLCEDAERRRIHELKSIAPEEWRLKYAEELKAPSANIGNKLLNSLPFTDLALMQPFLERIGLNFRSRLQMANRTIKTIHFPESGMISVVAVSGGGRHQTQIGL